MNWRNICRALAGTWLAAITLVCVLAVSFYGGLMFWALDACTTKACVVATHAAPIVLIISTVVGWCLFWRRPGVSVLVSGALIAVPVLFWRLGQATH